jgi:hypothetical protein
MTTYLIGGGAQEQFSILTKGEPFPARSKSCRGTRVELRLHLVERSKVGLNLLLQCAHGRRVRRAGRRHDRPEHSVVADDEQMNTKIDGRPLVSVWKEVFGAHESVQHRVVVRTNGHRQRS